VSDHTCYEINIFDQRPDPTYGTGNNKWREGALHHDGGVIKFRELTLKPL
jgi:hypothetical protein